MPLHSIFLIVPTGKGLFLPFILTSHKIVPLSWSYNNIKGRGFCYFVKACHYFSKFLAFLRTKKLFKQKTTQFFTPIYSSIRDFLKSFYPANKEKIPFHSDE